MPVTDNGDPIYGLPYVGTPVLQAPRVSEMRTVLDMWRGASRLVQVTPTDNHYTPDGSLYHE